MQVQIFAWSTSSRPYSDSKDGATSTASPIGSPPCTAAGSAVSAAGELSATIGAVASGAGSSARRRVEMQPMVPVALGPPGGLGSRCQSPSLLGAARARARV
jgi:hypothetical protein